MYDLLKFSAKEIPGYLQAFADDLVTLAEGSDTGVIWQRTQKTINTIEKWCDTKGLNISALKTKISQNVQVVRPILSYSATVWVRTLDNKNNLKALALRIMTGAFPSTPFNSLNHLTPHNGCYLKGEAAKGAAILQGYNYWTVETAPSVKGTITAILTTIS